MTHASTAREALISEAIGDVADLVKTVEALAPQLDAICQALREASTGLRGDLASFESRLTALTDNAKSVTIKYLATRVAETTERSLNEQSRAMSDAARVAFGAELGATLQRMQAMLPPLIERRDHVWMRYLTHAMAAAAGSVATWALAAHRWVS